MQGVGRRWEGEAERRKLESGRPDACSGQRWFAHRWCTMFQRLRSVEGSERSQGSVLVTVPERQVVLRGCALGVQQLGYICQLSHRKDECHANDMTS